jgi:hypothetical protein
MKKLIGIICILLFVCMLFSGSVIAQEKGYRVEINIVYNVVNKKEVGDLIEDIIRDHDDACKLNVSVKKADEDDSLTIIEGTYYVCEDDNPDLMMSPGVLNKINAANR